MRGPAKAAVASAGSEPKRVSRSSLKSVSGEMLTNAAQNENVRRAPETVWGRAGGVTSGNDRKVRQRQDAGGVRARQPIVDIAHPVIVKNEPVAAHGPVTTEAVARVVGAVNRAQSRHSGKTVGRPRESGKKPSEKCQKPHRFTPKDRAQSVHLIWKCASRAANSSDAESATTPMPFDGSGCRTATAAQHVASRRNRSPADGTPADMACVAPG